MNTKKRWTPSLIIRTAAAWGIALLLFFPLIFMGFTAFKTELQAIAVPSLWAFEPTFENFEVVNERSDYVQFAWNSVVTSVLSTVLGLLIAAPAAYSMAFAPTKGTNGLLLWMLSTKFMPAVGALLPIYVIFQQLNMLDTKAALVIIFTMMNLPIMVWMLYTYFKDIPKDILEAARLDGATLWQEMVRVLLPIAKGGLASTALLSLILCWNEAFWSLNLTSSNAAPLTALIASYSSPEGLFWAKLSAVSTLACAPILIFGWISQKQLVRGLSFGAVK